MCLEQLQVEVKRVRARSMDAVTLRGDDPQSQEEADFVDQLELERKRRAQERLEEFYASVGF